MAHGDGSAGGGAQALSTLIADSDPPTAVFCMSDEMAFGALHAAQSAGMAVPGDLSVIGFDDHETGRRAGPHHDAAVRNRDGSGRPRNW